MPISTPQFLVDGITRNGILSASSFAPSFEVARLQQMWVNIKWRSIGKTSEYIIFESTSTVPTTGMAFFGSNFTSSVVLTLYRWDGAQWVDMSVTFATVAGDVTKAGYGIASWNSVSTTKYKLVIADTTNADGYVEFSVPRLGLFYNLTRGPEYGCNDDWDDVSDEAYSLAGNLSVAEGFEINRKAYQFEVTSVDKDTLTTVWRLCRKSRPFVYIENSLDKIGTMSYSRFNTGLKRTREDAYFYGLQFGMESVL